MSSNHDMQNENDAASAATDPRLGSSNPRKETAMNAGKDSSPIRRNQAGRPWSSRLLQSLVGQRLERLPNATELPRDHPHFERVRCEVIRKDEDGNWTKVVDAYWTIERREG